MAIVPVDALKTILVVRSADSAYLTMLAEEEASEVKQRGDGLRRASLEVDA